ncbi:hypothetical protein K2W90_01130 [Candidatus Babeliales bacterium]|nr:hypothetical protein [Candidatus Babeliales bacterium]
MKNFSKNLQYAALSLLVAVTIGSQAHTATASKADTTKAKDAFNAVITQVASSLNTIGYNGTSIASVLANLTDFIARGPKGIQKTNTAAVTQAQQLARSLREELFFHDRTLAHTTNKNMQKIIAGTASNGSLSIIASEFDQAVSSIKSA